MAQKYCFFIILAVLCAPRLQAGSHWSSTERQVNVSIDSNLCLIQFDDTTSTATQNSIIASIGRVIQVRENDDVTAQFVSCSL
jgi:hypothetical protein